MTTRTLRAFISVTDKTGLEKFKRWTDAGHEIVSTGGTYRKLVEEFGIPCTPVEKVTGFREILGGRVKSMHPKIVGGMLGDTNNPAHRAEMKDNGIEPFHLVVVNLYQFGKKPGIENIDVGGPTALRSAAKNGACIAAVTDPNDYDYILGQLLTNGCVDEPARELLAIKVFDLTSEYDAAIAKWMKLKRGRGEPIFASSQAAH